MSQALGILGGTFDPIHFGHLRSALDVAEQLDLDTMYLVPSARPPHRQQPKASAEQRLEMLRLAVNEQARFVVDDRELHRQGQSYTIDTLLSFRAEFAERPIYLLLGTDAFQHIATWHRWQELLDYCHIVVMQRPNEPLSLTPELSKWYQRRLATSADAQKKSGYIWPVTVTQLDISATTIRNKVAKNESVQFLLPDQVAFYIANLGLYKNHG
ncbi:MAG: nicotinate-nicotinamide nucleotide adenylyltransferase [Gammaproteobacteria bacterium]|nr:MAG: nicotinate-nicotinamide nucleotide adenylyltransferase [Gammaproteobacteria bacterium]